MNHPDRNIAVMMVYKITGTLFFFVPILTLFWQENGLTLLEVMTLQSIFSIASVLLEVPSGMLADRYGRRKLLIAASFMLLVGLTIYCMADDFYSFLAAELSLAVWLAFTSGADTALLYDSLKESGREDEYTRTWGSIQFFSLIALAIVNILGGIIASYSLRYTLYASLPFSVMAFVSSFYFVEAGKGAPTQSVKQQIVVIVELFKQHSPLIWIIIYGGLIFAFNQGGLWIYQPYFKITGIDIIYFGVIFALYQTVAAIASRYTWWLQSYFGESRVLASLLIFSTGASLAMGLHPAIYSFLIIFIHQIVRGIFPILVSNQINMRVGTSVRASVLSINALIGRIIYALLIPVVGWLADVYSVEAAFTIMGITGLASAIPILFVLRRVGII